MMVPHPFIFWKASFYEPSPPLQSFKKTFMKVPVVFLFSIFTFFFICFFIRFVIVHNTFIVEDSLGVMPSYICSCYMYFFLI